MIESDLDKAHSILVVRPRSALTADDFANLSKTVDPFIESTGKLEGLILDAPSFPDWEGLGALVAHIRFVRDHVRRVKKVAVVTDSKVGKLAEKLASHFVAAEIRQFPAGQVDAAKQWITGGA